MNIHLDETQLFASATNYYAKINYHFQSLIGIGAIGGALIGGWAIEYFGRKTALMLYSIPFAAGWLLIANAQYGWMLFLGRILTGMAVGSTSLTVPVCHSSFCHPLFIYAKLVYND